MSISNQRWEDETREEIGPWLCADIDTICWNCLSEIDKGSRMRYVNGVQSCEECGKRWAAYSI